MLTPTGLTYLRLWHFMSGMNAVMAIHLYRMLMDLGDGA